MCGKNSQGHYLNVNFIISVPSGNTSSLKSYLQVSKSTQSVDLNTFLLCQQQECSRRSCDSIILGLLCMNQHLDLWYSKQQTVKSLGQSDTDIHFNTMQRFFFFLALLYIYFLCYLDTKDVFSHYKSHVKSPGITKTCVYLKMWSEDVVLNENKGFTYCFEAVYAAEWMNDGDYVNIAWAPGFIVLPLFKQFEVYGTLQLASPKRNSLYSKERRTDWKWWVKTQENLKRQRQK